LNQELKLALYGTYYPILAEVKLIAYVDVEGSGEVAKTLLHFVEVAFQPLTRELFELWKNLACPAVPKLRQAAPHDSEKGILPRSNVLFVNPPSLKEVSTAVRGTVLHGFACNPGDRVIESTTSGVEVIIQQRFYKVS
jgi:hypothetical protein